MFNILLNILFFFVLLSGCDTGYGRIRVREESVSVPHWNSRLDELNFLLVSDLHLRSSYFANGEAEKLIALINAQNADYILLLGDYINVNMFTKRPDASIEQFNFFLSHLKAKRGIFAITGNHDQRFDETKIIKTLRQNKIAVVGPKFYTVYANGAAFQLVSADYRARYAYYKNFFRRVPQSLPVLVMIHSPVTIQYMPNEFHLFLAGHTHGGQIVLPFFRDFSFSWPFYIHYPTGVNHQSEHTVILSAGVGYSNLPLRIGAPPEITKLRITGKK